MEEPIRHNTSEGVKTILHFSDGTMEIDEVKSEEATQTFTEINTKEMEWGPWMWHQTSRAGNKTLEVCDYFGESLANFFGITTPKYQFEINEYQRIIKEEESEKKQRDLELGSWANAEHSKNAVLAAPHGSAVEPTAEIPKF